MLGGTIGFLAAQQITLTLLRNLKEVKIVLIVSRVVVRVHRVFIRVLHDLKVHKPLRNAPPYLIYTEHLHAVRIDLERVELLVRSTTICYDLTILVLLKEEFFALHIEHLNSFLAESLALS